MTRSKRLSPHFTLTELTASATARRLGIDNRPSPEIVPALVRTAHHLLEPPRVHFGIPFSPSSGYRSAALNRAIGGAEGSQHRLGQAVDFEIPRVANWTLAAWMANNIAFDQLILEYPSHRDPRAGWIHASYVGRGQNRGEVLTRYRGRWVRGLPKYAAP